MSLYVVTFEVEMVVVGDSREDAEENAQDYLHTAVSDCLFDGASSCRQIKDERGVPIGWGDCIPYASEDDRTVRQILRAPDPEPEPVKDDRTLPMFPTPTTEAAP